MELNREKIIKAWECCHTLAKDCLTCPYENDNNGCIYLEQNALALIKELTEENERLSKEVADLQDELKCEKETNEHLCSQYMSESHLRHQVEEMLANGMDAVKADTVKKIRKRLHEEAFAVFDDEGAIDCYAVDLDDIDRILKEILEDKNVTKNN